MAENPSGEPSFESAIADLEKILRQLEDGSTNLEDSLTCYEHGIGLIKTCYAQLKNAELRIQKLTAIDADGNPILEPLSTEKANLLSTEPPARAARKSRPKGPGNSTEY